MAGAIFGDFEVQEQQLIIEQVQQLFSQPQEWIVKLSVVFYCIYQLAHQVVTSNTQATHTK